MAVFLLVSALNIFMTICKLKPKSVAKWYNEPTRLIVFSDSQDCDRNHKLPKPFAKYNYIIDVSAHTRGVNYQGVWTAEISGWSEHFLRYIASLRG